MVLFAGKLESKHICMIFPMEIHIMNVTLKNITSDFRQILPIVRRGNLLDQANATSKALSLWESIHKFKLTTNIQLGGLQAQKNPMNTNFACWLLDLGSGVLQEDYVAETLIMYCNVSLLRLPHNLTQLW